MSAGLDRFEDGKARMFYRGETPWHKEGFALADDQGNNFDGVLTKFFDIPLVKAPYYYPGTDEAGNQKFVEATDAFYVQRTDTKKNLGKVGGDYEIVTNRQAFEILKPLIDDGAATIETGGVLRGGADAWMLCRWNLDRFGSITKEVFGDELLPYATVMANHNGRRGVMIGQTAIRIVCANTLSMAESEAGRSSDRWIQIMHTKGAGVKLVEAAEKLFANVVEKYERMARHYKLLKEVRLEDEQFAAMVLDVLAPDPRDNPKFNPDSKLAELVVERADRKRKEITRLWTEGKGHTGEKNAYFALNAAVEALDHNYELFPTRNGSWRTAQLLTGTYADMKNAVTDRLTAFALAL